MISSAELLLHYLSDRFFFIFIKKVKYFLLCSILLLYAHSVWAFFSDGKIDDNFSYRSLRIEMDKSKKKGCYLEGEIINNTTIPQEDISVTFYAYDFFDHFLWKQTVRIDLVDSSHKSRNGSQFRKKMRQCDMPDKFQFKVAGVKGKVALKAFPDKPTSEKTVSHKSWQKNDSTATDFHSDPVNRQVVEHSQDNSMERDVVSDAGISVVSNRKYLIILTNGKEISTNSCWQQDNVVYFYQGGGEVQISKDKVSEIRKLN
jgi:hypothetical protein